MAEYTVLSDAPTSIKDIEINLSVKSCLFAMIGCAFLCAIHTLRLVCGLLNGMKMVSDHSKVSIAFLSSAICFILVSMFAFLSNWHVWTLRTNPASFSGGHHHGKWYMTSAIFAVVHIMFLSVCLVFDDVMHNPIPAVKYVSLIACVVGIYALSYPVIKFFLAGWDFGRKDMALFAGKLDAALKSMETSSQGTELASKLLHLTDERRNLTGRMKHMWSGGNCIPYALCMTGGVLSGCLAEGSYVMDAEFASGAATIAFVVFACLFIFGPLILLYLIPQKADESMKKMNNVDTSQMDAGVSSAYCLLVAVSSLAPLEITLSPFNCDWFSLTISPRFIFDVANGLFVQTPIVLSLVRKTKGWQM